MYSISFNANSLSFGVKNRLPLKSAKRFNVGEIQDKKISVREHKTSRKVNSSMFSIDEAILKIYSKPYEHGTGIHSPGEVARY